MEKSLATFCGLTEICTQPLTKIADIFEYFPSGELGSGYETSLRLTSKEMKSPLLIYRVVFIPKDLTVIMLTAIMLTNK